MKILSKKATIILSGCLFGSLVLASSMPAQAVTDVKWETTITVDNSYALYWGTETNVTHWEGNDFDWPTTEIYHYTLPSDNYLYIVTVSDIAIAQGLLGQFKNLDQNYVFYSNDPQWQVTATGKRDPTKINFGAPYTNSMADFDLLTEEILRANGKTNASLGWVATTAGPANGGDPWLKRPLIDAAARWVWYDKSKSGTDPTTPGFNHDEWLVFRIRIGATPQSAPGPLPLLGVASAWAWSRRLRNRIRSHAGQLRLTRRDTGGCAIGQETVSG